MLQMTQESQGYREQGGITVLIYSISTHERERYGCYDTVQVSTVTARAVEGFFPIGRIIDETA